jgi:predicted nucleotidyltransferase
MTTGAKTRLGIADVIGEHRDEILRIAAAHGASNVRVFGSVARGEAGENSDLDLLVTWDYERMTSWGSAGLWLELEALLQRPVDITSERGLSPFIYDAVMNEAVPL